MTLRPSFFSYQTLPLFLCRITHGSCLITMCQVPPDCCADVIHHYTKTGALIKPKRSSIHPKQSCFHVIICVLFVFCRREQKRHTFVPAAALILIFESFLHETLGKMLMPICHIGNDNFIQMEYLQSVNSSYATQQLVPY